MEPKTEVSQDDNLITLKEYAVLVNILVKLRKSNSINSKEYDNGVRFKTTVGNIVFKKRE